ncbi:transposase family protein [Streptomyces sp. NPDC006285]|uniref:transposase family protein n=1 Tax=Streptomyces sp. NPDC006285 TaxID=3364742 RepID=UPI0036CA3795
MEEVLLRLKELLFPSIVAVAVLSADVHIAIVRVDARCTADGAACPVCGTWSNRVHGSYLRFPADVPSGGRGVVLQLKVRRFTCGNSDCARRTFVEQMPGLTRRHSQRTERLRSTLASVGLALAGRAGARIAGVLGTSVSRSTVLRLVDALPEPEQQLLRAVRTHCPEIDALTRHVRAFAVMLTERQGERLPDWLVAVRQDNLPSLHTLTAGIDRHCASCKLHVTDLVCVRLGRLVVVTGGWLGVDHRSAGYALVRQYQQGPNQHGRPSRVGASLRRAAGPLNPRTPAP